MEELQEELTQKIKDRSDYYVNYIENVCQIHVREDIETIFKYYLENKTELYRLFGRELSFSKNITLETREEVIRHRLEDLYYDNIELGRVCRNHIFISDLQEYIKENFSPFTNPDNVFHVKESSSPRIKLYHYVNNIIDYDVIVSQRVQESFTLDVVPDKKQIEIKEGTKPMKAMRKLLEYIGYEHNTFFLDWRDQISTCLTNKGVSGTLVVSIDPIDFLTLSNNQANWSTCMTLPEGSYSHNITTMLNSAYSFVAYLKDSDDYIVNGVKYPNKAWRTLGFFDVDDHKWICNTRNYPYSSVELSNAVIDMVKERLETFNLQFGSNQHNHAYENFCNIVRDFYVGCGHSVDEEACEGCSYYCDGYCEYDEDDDERFYDELKFDTELQDYLMEYTDTPNVFLYTDPYYNDIRFMNDTEDDYDGTSEEYRMAWNKNYRYTGTFVDVAGPHTCLCCGEDREVRDYYYNEHRYHSNHHHPVKMCLDCIYYNKNWDYIAIPVLDSRLANYKQIADTLHMSLEELHEDIYDMDVSNFDIRDNYPVIRFNDFTFDEVKYLKSIDRKYSFLDIFCTSNIGLGDVFDVAYVTQDENGEYYPVEIGGLSDADVYYFTNEIEINADKYEIFKRQYGNNHLTRRWKTIEIDNDLRMVDIILPIEFKDKKNKVWEVISDKERKYEIISSL